MIAVVVRVGQAPEKIELPHGQDAAFTRVQELVGGYVERVSWPSFELDVYCDEDGISKNLPHNRLGLRGTFVVLARCLTELRGLTKDDASNVFELLLSVPS